MTSTEGPAGDDSVLIRRLPDLLRARARFTPDDLAHDDTSTTLTFAEWDGAADDIGGGLVTVGVRPDDRVLLAISNKNASSMAAVFIGVHRAGGICAPVSTRLKKPELEAYRGLVGADLVITDVPDAVADIGCSRVLTLAEVPRDRSALPDQSSLSASGDSDIIGTSGTTGAPKGVVFTHAELVDGQDGRSTTPSKRLMHALPFTGYGGCHGVMLLPLRNGTAVITQPSFDPGSFLKLIAVKRPQSLQLVPAMLRLLVEHPGAAAGDMSSVRWVFTGTAPLPHDTVERFQTLWPSARLINVYGMTEGGGGTQTKSGSSLNKPGSVGRPAEAGTIEIRDEAGIRVIDGVTGEIWTKVKTTRRYWNDPDATASTFPGGWVKSGDLGLIDADGDLILVGRSKELIIRGGYNISPVEVEDVLLLHPKVREAAVPIADRA